MVYNTQKYPPPPFFLISVSKINKTGPQFAVEQGVYINPSWASLLPSEQFIYCIKLIQEAFESMTQKVYFLILLFQNRAVAAHVLAERPLCESLVSSHPRVMLLDGGLVTLENSKLFVMFK